MERGDKVVVYHNEYSVCTGCRSCEMLCAVMHDGTYSPDRSRIGFEVGNLKEMMHGIYTCQQCADHPCYDACPKQGEAMGIDDETGVVYVDQEKCIGCGLCVKACTFEPKRIHVMKKGGQRHAVKCDLCRGIEGGPICISHCPTMKLGLASESADDLRTPKGYVITSEGCKKLEETEA